MHQSKDRTTIAVLRHRLTTFRGQAAALGGRWLAALRTQRGLTAGVVAVAAAGVVAAGGVAAGVGSGQPASSALSTTVATADRQAAVDKADRSARTAPATGAQAVAKAPAKAAVAAPKAAASKPAAKPAAKKPAAAPKPAWVTPMARFELTSCFGPRWGTAHEGIDFANVEGTPIRAIGAGTIFAAGWNYTGYGISVVVDHHNGYFTHYAHASRVAVHPGQRVAAGQVIAYEGSTGDSTGPHLHFEVHKGMWNQIDPAPWLRAHGVKVGC